MVPLPIFIQLYGPFSKRANKGTAFYPELNKKGDSPFFLGSNEEELHLLGLFPFLSVREAVSTSNGADHPGMIPIFVRMASKIFDIWAAEKTLLVLEAA